MLLVTSAGLSSLHDHSSLFLLNGRSWHGGTKFHPRLCSSRVGSSLEKSLFLGGIGRSFVSRFGSKRFYKSFAGNDSRRKLAVVARAFENGQVSIRRWNSNSSVKPSRWDAVKTNQYPKGRWKPRRSRPKLMDDPARIAKVLEGRDGGKVVVERQVMRVPPEVRGWDQGSHDHAGLGLRGRGEELVRNANRQTINVRDKLRALDLKKFKEVDLRKKLKEIDLTKLKEVDLRKLKDVDLKKLVTMTIDAARSTPLPPLSGSLIATVGGVVILGLFLDMLIWRVTGGPSLNYVRTGMLSVDAVTGSAEDSVRSSAPSALSVLLERDLRRKESVEWLNMVIDKLWNLYRRALEDWLVSVLQPTIDNLEKPEYVKKVQVKQFFLGDEPMSVRTVERRTSRRADDLQYHVGVRYTGGARLLLLITLKWGIFPLTIPVGVRGLDVDAEVWVKFRMIPTEPWIGQATWAFVTLPKIKLALAPFRLVNLMSIPFLSIFLAKLLTEDLPQLFVRPNKNVVDFLQGKAIGPVTKDFKNSVISDQSSFFTGELSVTLIECRKLSYIPYLKTDPYVIFVLGEQVVRSKKNSQTSIIGAPGAPVWNQDFKLLVVDQETQYLSLTVHDTIGFTSYPVGSTDIDLRTLQDTVPVDRKLVLKSGWGPFPKRFAGELVLRLTYKAYIDEEGQEIPVGPGDGVYTNAVEQMQEVATFFKEEAGKVAEFFQDKDLAKEMFSSLSSVTSKEDAERVQPILDSHKARSVGKADINDVHSPNLNTLPVKSALTSASTEKKKKKANKDKGSSSVENSPTKIEGKQVTIQNEDGKNSEKVLPGETETEDTPPFVWLVVLTGVILLVALDLNLSNVLNP